MADPFYYPIFDIDDPDELDRLLSAAGLGTLISGGPESLTVTHIPFVFDPAARLLKGHVSLRNPHSQSAARNALVLFGGPQAYVSPGYYPSKAVDGRVAPTWNYQFLHVHGSVRWIDDPQWLLRNLEDLTNRHEDPRAEPWRVEDAPADFTQKLLRRIVGVEITVEHIACRRKFSQNESEANREGVIAGLTAASGMGERQLAAAMRGADPGDLGAASI